MNAVDALKAVQYLADLHGLSEDELDRAIDDLSEQYEDNEEIEMLVAERFRQRTQRILNEIQTSSREESNDDYEASKLEAKNPTASYINECDKILKERLKVFPNLRFSFLRISIRTRFLEKISILASSIILIPLRIIQDIYYHAKQLGEWAFKKCLGLNEVENTSNSRIYSDYA